MYGFAKEDDVKRVIAATKQLEAIPLNNTGRSLTGGPKGSSPFVFVSLTPDGGDIGTQFSTATVTYSVWEYPYPNMGTALATTVPWTNRPNVIGSVVPATFSIAQTGGPNKYILGYTNETLDDGACGTG